MIATAASSTRQPLERAGERRGDRRDAGRDAHRDREDVVREQRGRGDEPGPDPEVLAGDDVAAAAVRVGPDRLPVGHDDDREDGHDERRDGQREPECAGPGGQQGEQDRLGRVGHRRQVVAAEDGQRLDLGQALGGLLVVGEGPPEHRPPDAGQRATEGLVGLDGRRPRDDEAVADVAKVGGRGRLDLDAAIRPVAARSLVGSRGRRVRKADRERGRRPPRRSIEKLDACRLGLGGRDPDHAVDGDQSDEADAEAPRRADELDRGIDLGEVVLERLERRAQHGVELDGIHALTVGRPPRGQRPRTGLAALNVRSIRGSRSPDPVADAGLGRDQAAGLAARVGGLRACAAAG